MQIMPVQIIPATSSGPSSPMDLAEKREKALLTQSTQPSETPAAPSSQDWAAEKIARGADPDAVLGGMTGESGGPDDTGQTAQGRLAELVARGADPEAIFALVSGGKPNDTGEAPMRKLQEAVEAHRSATQGYASASQAFRDAITAERVSGLDMRIGETSRLN